MKGKFTVNELITDYVFLFQLQKCNGDCSLFIFSKRTEKRFDMKLKNPKQNGGAWSFFVVVFFSRSSPMALNRFYAIFFFLPLYIYLSSFRFIFFIWSVNGNKSKQILKSIVWTSIQTSNQKIQAHDCWFLVNVPKIRVIF